MRKWLFVMSTGFILVFYSEYMFWGRIPAESTPLDILLTWLFYSLSGFAMLIAIEHFHIRRVQVLFLAGALFGWLTEGVIVQTVYEELPLSISFTALAWHALISTMMGWYGLAYALLQGGAWRWVLGIGVLWGFWAVFWHLEDPAAAVSTSAFLRDALLLTGGLLPAYWLFHRTAAAFSSRPAERYTVIVLFMGLFLLAVMAVPIALFVLPVLMGILWWALLRNRSQEKQMILTVLAGAPPLYHYLPLLLLPFVAALTHALLLSVGFLETGYIVYVITTFLGFWWLFRTLWDLRRGKTG